MNASSGNFPTEQNHVTGLPFWWGLPKTINASDIESRVKKFQVLKGDINKLFHEASSRQAQALKTANERSIGYFQDLFAARQPSELMSAQSNIVTSFMESLADQTKSWLELTRKLQDCSAAMVAEKAAETVETTALPIPADAQSEADELVDRETARALLRTGREKLSSIKSRPVSRARKK